MTHAAAAGQKILRFCLHFVQLFLKRWGNKQNQTKQWNRQREGEREEEKESGKRRAVSDKCKAKMLKRS